MGKCKVSMSRSQNRHSYTCRAAKRNKNHDFQGRHLKVHWSRSRAGVECLHPLPLLCRRCHAMRINAFSQSCLCVVRHQRPSRTLRRPVSGLSCQRCLARLYKSSMKSQQWDATGRVQVCRSPSKCWSTNKEEHSLEVRQKSWVSFEHQVRS